MPLPLNAIWSSSLFCCSLPHRVPTVGSLIPPPARIDFTSALKNNRFHLSFFVWKLLYTWLCGIMLGCKGVNEVGYNSFIIYRLDIRMFGCQILHKIQPSGASSGRELLGAPSDFLSGGSPVKVSGCVPRDDCSSPHPPATSAYATERAPHPLTSGEFLLLVRWLQLLLVQRQVGNS